MVCRLIQNQKISFRKHKFGKGYPAPLATADILYSLKDIIFREQESCQYVADGGVIQMGVAILQFIKEGFIRIKNLMLLVIISDMDFAANPDLTAVGCKTAVNNFQDGCFTCAVIAD